MIQNLLDFFKYQNLLKNVRRNNWMEDGRKESSAEHSWSVAMMVWFLKEPIEKELGIQLDEQKLIKMALIHDLVEINAGDVGAWDDKGRTAIKDLEHQALEQMYHKYFENKLPINIKQLWLEHEQLKTFEAKLVKACDQLCPLVYRVVYKCSYDGTGVNKNKLDSIFLQIVSFSTITHNLYIELRNEIEQLGLFDASSSS